MAALLLEDAQVAPNTDAAVIGEQNDIFRRHLGFAALWKNQPLTGEILMTPGITALPEVLQIALMREVVNFRDFNAENDPWGDHGFGVVEVNGTRAFWKIDVLDASGTHGITVPDAADPSKVSRVLTIYLPSEH